MVEQTSTFAYYHHLHRLCPQRRHVHPLTGYVIHFVSQGMASYRGRLMVIVRIGGRVSLSEIGNETTDANAFVRVNRQLTCRDSAPFVRLDLQFLPHDNHK